MEGRVTILLLLLVRQNTFLHLGKFSDLLREENGQNTYEYFITCLRHTMYYTRVGTLIVATIYLQLIQNRDMFRSFTVLQCSHQHFVQPVASDVEVVGYL